MTVENSRLSIEDLDFFFEPHHTALADSLAAVETALLAEEHVDHTPEYQASLARNMGEKYGLYEWLVPDDGPVDVRALCLIREMLGYASPLGDGIFAVQGLGSYPIKLAGNADQKQHWLPRVRTGESIGGFALTEPGAGSDVAAMSTTALEQDDHYVLNGEKIFISNVGIAEFFTVFANVDLSLGHKGITAFIIPADTAGLRTEAQKLSVDHPIGKLIFEDCRIPKSALLGDIGQGFKLAMQTLDSFRASVGAAAVGMGRRALREALTHTKQRVQFGKPLTAQQQVQAYLAEMALEVDASRLLVLRAARAKDKSGGRVTTEVSMAKLFATEAAQRIIDKGVQLLGGLGVCDGQAVERLYREIRPLRIYEGTTEIQKVIIARALIKGD